MYNGRGIKNVGDEVADEEEDDDDNDNYKYESCEEGDEEGSKKWQ